MIIPVPEAMRDAYVEWAKMSAARLEQYGCREIVEAWEDDIPNGTRTDFRRAVEASPDEKIVYVWQIWPDKASLEAAESRMHADGAFDYSGAVPFDAARLIYGGFTPLHVRGRDDA